MPGTDQSRPPKVGLPKTRRANSHGHGGGGSRRPWQETFKLHSMDDASLKRMIDCIGASSAGRYRTCVISIISKESLGQTVRDKLVQNIIPQRHRPTSATPTDKESDSLAPVEPTYENQLLGQVDVHEGLVVLSLESYLETSKLLDLCKDFTGDGSPGSIHKSLLMKSWPGWNQNLLKTLLIIFTLSNIIVFYNTEPSIDYNLIRLLRILEIQRNKSQSRICDLLATIATGQVFSQQWIRNARISCPRALFVCDTSQLDIDFTDYHAARNDIEDQIAYLLKKAGLVQTLVSISDNEDFVYIMTKRESEMKLETPQVESSMQSNAQDELTSLPLSEPAAHGQRAAHRPNRFRKFIMRHVSSIQSLANYAQDHDGKQAGVKYTARAQIIPRFDDFFEVLLRLKWLLFPPALSAEEQVNPAPHAKPDWSRPDERRFIDVFDSLNIDDAFSLQHCQKARVAAFDFYARGLQVGQCDEQAHRDLLESAKSFYINHARGPAKSSNLDLLIESCNTYWQETLAARNEIAQRQDNSAKLPGGAKPHRGPGNVATSSTSMRPLAVTRKPNGSIRVACSCQCGHETNLIIKPSDRRKKLERLDIYQVE